MKKIPTIICARGGSKRLPRKNVLLFHGHPLIAWAITAAKHCKYVDDVWVSTDDDEIADISEQYGARIIRRPDWPDADTISAGRPTVHAREEIKKHYDFDTYSSNLATSPCWHPWDYDRLFERYFEIKKVKPDARGVFPYCQPVEVVIYRALYYGACIPILGTKTGEYLMPGPMKIVVDEKEVIREYKEQVKANEFIEQDAIEDFRARAGFFKMIYYYYLTKWYQGYDIDNQETWELNEIFMEKYILQGRGIEIYQEYAENSDRGKEV